jgi:coenzyme PQQ synthesis protein D (PqqD)
MSFESPSAAHPNPMSVGSQMRVRIPDHVAHRAFSGQTVLLNLQRGEYHGLGGAGAPMLEALDEGQTVDEVAAGIAGRYGIAFADAQRDVVALCTKLLARGLVEPA